MGSDLFHCICSKIIRPDQTNGKTKIKAHDQDEHRNHKKYKVKERKGKWEDWVRWFLNALFSS